MISKHVHYEAAHDNYGALARYIADASHEDEKCLASWCAGCAADDDYELSIVEAQAAQALNTRSQKEKTYHLLISFRPEDEAKLTPETFKAIEERFAAVLGYAEHQRHCGVHKNTGNIHMHIAYNMAHPERYARHEPFRDYATRDKLCRELEQEFGLSVDSGREQRQENALRHKAATIEAQKERELLERHDLSTSGKKTLQAFLRMEQITAEAKAQGQALGNIERHIDGKGIVIFSLENGGTIRDTGKDIFYSSHDAKAQEIAALYAAKKWGKYVALKQGRIIFQPEYKIDRSEPELPQKQKGLSR